MPKFLIEVAHDENELAGRVAHDQFSDPLPDKLYRRRQPTIFGPAKIEDISVEDEQPGLSSSLVQTWHQAIGRGAVGQQMQIRNSMPYCRVH